MTEDDVRVTIAGLPSLAEAQRVVDRVAPGGRARAVRPLPGSYSNWTHRVDVAGDSAGRARLVVRRYAPCSVGPAAKARLEYRALAWLAGRGVPAPEPLLLDEDGALLGSPGIVTTFVPGRAILAPRDPRGWGRAMGEMLTRIHALPLDDAARGFLLDADAEATWFLRGGAPPPWMAADPDGPAIWDAVCEGLPRRVPVAPALVHIDFWRGNVLWDGGRISAVVDWEEAACGDPAYDVAYCLLDLTIMGQVTAAETFLAAYEAAYGGPVANLALWRLAAAARPLTDPPGWLTNAAKARRFRQFMREARTTP